MKCISIISFNEIPFFQQGSRIVGIIVSTTFHNGQGGFEYQPQLVCEFFYWWKCLMKELDVILSFKIITIDRWTKKLHSLIIYVSYYGESPSLIFFKSWKQFSSTLLGLQPQSRLLCLVTLQNFRSYTVCLVGGYNILNFGNYFCDVQFF